MTYRPSMAVCAFLLATMVVGCRSEPTPEFALVSGTVKLNGKPHPGLLLRFTPDPEQGNGFPAFASGISDNQGQYALKYEFRGKEGDGAPVGWHRVSVIDTSVGHTPQGQAPKPSAVPYRFGNPSTTPIVVEVKADEPQQTIDIDVR